MDASEAALLALQNVQRAERTQQLANRYHMDALLQHTTQSPACDVTALAVSCRGTRTGGFQE